MTEQAPRDVIRIATRKSPLALWQAEFVKHQLEQAHPGLSVELLGIKTRGDIILDTPLAKVGGKGLFVKEPVRQRPVYHRPVRQRPVGQRACSTKACSSKACS